MRKVTLGVITAFVSALAIPAVAGTGVCKGTETGAYYANSGDYFDGAANFVNAADLSHTTGRVDGMGRTHSMGSTVYGEIMNLSKGGGNGECPTDDEGGTHDFNGTGRLLIEASTVTRAANGALLYFHSTDGENCFRAGAGSRAETRGEIVGGTGKYEDATGTGTIVTETEQVMSDSRFGSLQTTAELYFEGALACR